MSHRYVRTGTDAWTDASRPALNMGRGNRLRVQASGPEKHVFVYFKSPVPRGGTVLSADLVLYEIGAFGSSVQIDVKRVGASWKESGINYGNEPGGTGSTVSLTQTGTADAQEWRIDVTALVQAWADGATNYGLRITTTDTTERQFYSLNATDHLPLLDVEWSDAPDAPTELSPAGNAAVSIAKPVLSFNFHDVSGETAMQACRIQLKATNTGWTSDPTTGGYASPDYDTETDFPGGVPTSDPEFDLSTGTYSGLSTGSSTYWTVQVQDAAGLWSPWSQPRVFQRVAKGTLTVTSPSGGVVNDATQTVIWAMSGSGITQQAWQVIVVDDSNPTVQLLNTGRRSGTATSFTLPKGVVTDESATYRLTVRTWDTITRAQTPGDAIKYEDVSTFTFSPGVPAAPSAVVLSQAAPGNPHVNVDITISAAPDYFAVIRNGMIIDTDIVPADIYLSGTTYRYVDRTAAPGVAYTYHVRSKVAGVSGPTRTATPNPFTVNVLAVWLMDWSDPGSTRLVPVMVALSDLSFDMPEIGTTFAPVNGKAGVRVTQGQQGLTGHIAGRIMTHAGLSAAASVADFLWMKARPENQLRLTLGKQNLRAVMFNAVCSPARSGEDDRDVSFDFMSLDGPTQ